MFILLNIILYLASLSSSQVSSIIHCSSSNDDESFCEQAIDKNHQTFWRSNDMTFEDSEHHHNEVLFLDFGESPKCTRNIRIDMNFCHYILDKADEFHFKDKLEECRNYYGEDDYETSNLLCGYIPKYMYIDENVFTDDVHNNNIFPIHHNFIELNREIKAVKFEFKCYLQNNVNSEDFGYKVNAIVREITFFNEEIRLKNNSCNRHPISLPIIIENIKKIEKSMSNYLLKMFLDFMVIISAITCVCFIIRSSTQCFKKKHHKKKKHHNKNNIINVESSSSSSNDDNETKPTSSLKTIITV